MTNLDIDIPHNIMAAYKQLIAIPYYKINETTYAFATHIIEDTEATKEKTALQSLLSSDIQPEAVAIFQNAIQALSECTISASDLLTWTTYHKAKGSVSKYQNILASVYHELLVDEIQKQITRNNDNDDNDNDDNDDFIDSICGIEIPYDTESLQEKSTAEYVLNRNNPFADISIKNQQFIYASDTDQFGTLSLNTSHTVTRIQHDEDKSYLVMQPGFKIKTTNNIQLTSPQDVIFDDELTSELAHQDDKIYVYMD